MGLERTVDVAVIGAGLAGLAAARQLHRDRLEVVVVEARDRVGGRTLNHPIGDGKIVEVGGQWVGPGQDRVLALIDELGLPTRHCGDESGTGGSARLLPRTARRPRPAHPAHAERFGHQDDGRLRHRPDAATPIDYIEKDWSADEWTRGCYGAFTPPNTWTEYGPALRAPVGRIHWAGAETATIWMGYMDGAIRSGERAAAEITALLGETRRATVASAGRTR
ncbi:FAD-dependent oxidoreductase [Nocardia sp. CA-119907]|uniref:flavin monoamine oxidase family protein n=1 Tax=Nocardia sp. CA-119907 TaxID=3239973 RepID=UPI003D954BA8